jgi:crossover junction endodeoxyribonuclease RusA
MEAEQESEEVGVSTMTLGMEEAALAERLKTFAFTVWGLPATAGSKRAFPFQRANGELGVNVTHDSKKSKPWMAAVAAAAREEYSGDLLRGAITLHVVFVLPRPKGHFRTGKRFGELRPTAPIVPAVKPDVSKMLRAIEDALTGVMWKDDAQIHKVVAEKIYGERPHAFVSVTALT